VTERLPLDEACQRCWPRLWAAYSEARAAAHGLEDLRRRVLSLRHDQEARLMAYVEARAALDAQVRGAELWARPGGRLAHFSRVPPSAVGVLQFDYEGRIATGDGLPPLYDVEVGLAPVAAVKRWRKRPSAADLKTAALAVAEGYQAANPPTEAVWKRALGEHLGETVTRKVARDALAQWAPQLRRQPGQKRNCRN
jgi:hypothetical protein